MKLKGARNPNKEQENDMPELDPTRTRLLRDEYAKALTQLTEAAMKRALQILESEPVNERMIEKLQSIIDQQMGGSAKPIIDRITILAYQRGTDYADRKLKAEGIQFSITRAAPAIHFAEVTVPFTPQNIAILDPETLQTLRALSLDLVKKLSDEIKGKLAAEIRQGILRSEHPRVIAKRFEDIAKMSKYRAEMIARTETIRAFNTAAEQRYKAAGVKRWKWLAADDERMCSQCAARDRKIYEMGDEIPPLHPHCRCTQAPVIERVTKTPQQTQVQTTYVPRPGKETLNDILKISDLHDAEIKKLSDKVEVMGNNINTLFDEHFRISKLYVGEQNPEKAKLLRAELDKLEKWMGTTNEIISETAIKANDLNKNLEGKLHESLYINAGSRLKANMPLANKYIDTAGRVNEGKQFVGMIVHSDYIENVGTIDVQIYRKGRASASGKTIYLNAKLSDLNDVIHEIGHTIEMNNNEVLQQSHIFYELRTKGQPLEQLRKIDKTRKYEIIEVAKRGNFIDPYMGRYYGEGRPTELISMGVEYLYKDTLEFARKDPEYFTWLLDVLRKI